MPISDYAHWNEDAERVWWEEEGKHYDEDAERAREDQLHAAQAFADDLAELTDDELRELRLDDDYLERWPEARKLIDWEMRYRKEHA